MPNDHALRHEINISSSESKVRAALTTAEGLRGWNTAAVSGNGGVGSDWRLDYGPRPSFTWRVVSSDADKIVWRCVSGPGDSAGTTVEFALHPLPNGRTRVSFVHSGWPHEQGNFIKCNTLWGALLDRLRAFVESGKPSPAYS